MVFEERARDEKFADVKNARILVGGRMIQRQTMKLTLPIATIALLLAGCEAGGESKSSFDKTLTVSGPIKLDLSNASGTVRITGSSDNKVHIHGDIQSHGMFFNDPDKQARELSANPPIEQKPDAIRVGSDVKANSVAGRVSVQGNPSANSYWNLKTTSGSVEVQVPRSANFHLSAEAVSGQIEAGIPIVIEDQDKHSLRARVGNAGGRVEIHTVSGGIKVEPAS